MFYILVPLKTEASSVAQILREYIQQRSLRKRLGTLTIKKVTVPVGKVCRSG